jgi:hypothetical protein
LFQQLDAAGDAIVLREFEMERASAQGVLHGTYVNCPALGEVKMYRAEAAVVMALGLCGLALFCSGVMQQQPLPGLGGLALYLAVWAYSLHRIATDVGG